MPKIELYYIEKVPLDRGNPSIHVIFRGVSLKSHFCYGPYMIACFHER